MFSAWPGAGRGASSVQKYEVEGLSAKGGSCTAESFRVGTKGGEEGAAVMAAAGEETAAADAIRLAERRLWACCRATALRGESGNCMLIAIPNINYHGPPRSPELPPPVPVCISSSSSSTADGAVLQ